jgi:ribonuclease J
MTQSNQQVRFIPLGGLDEVGMNCMVIEHGDSMLIVDCGITFPKQEQHGIDLVIPDWTYILDNQDKLEGIVVTHGHEDHVGAIPFLLKELGGQTEVYSAPLTLRLLRDKLNSHQIPDNALFNHVRSGDTRRVGPFELEFINVNHSIPDSLSVALRVDDELFVITGDWKLDQNETYEPVMDLQRFAELGREGVTGLLGDSTNAIVSGYSNSELDVQRGIADAMDRAEGRVIVAQFSSNQYRVAGLLEVAHKQRRKVCLLGRSLREKFEISLEDNYFDVPSERILIEPHEIDHYPNEKLLIIATGSQAERRAALTRMGLDEHHNLELDSTDTIILSARQIPGNERGIQNMINNLSKRGANVITGDEENIHASGHACQEELKLLMNLTDPDWLIPVHGEFRMRKKHAELGDAVGVSNHLVIENGDILAFENGDADVEGHIHTGRVFVDGENVGDLQGVEIRDRGKLASSGIVVALVIIDKDTGEITTGPELIQKGVLGEGEIESRLGEATKYAKQAFEKLSKGARKQPRDAEHALKQSIREFFRENINRQPFVIPIVHEL